MGSKLHKHNKNQPSAPLVHYNYALIYPQEFLPYVEEYCGRYEDLAAEFIDTYGGDDH